MAKLSAWSKKHMPGLGETGWTPALMRYRSASSGSVTMGPKPSTPFSEWNSTSFSGGTKLLHRVGMPTPRFTIMPSWNSLVARRAMVCSSSRSLSVSTTSRSLRSDDDAVHVNAGSHNPLGVELSQLHHLVHLGNGHVRGARHGGVEGAGRAVVDEVAVAVGLVGANEREVSSDGVL